jgi:2-polyprenyl-3-methyl-5-hydroxy-6-metoxy-1,4-benzoquinol methylase
MDDKTRMVLDSFLTLKEVFTTFGKTEPFWTVLTDPKYRLDRMNESSMTEFYDSGIGYGMWVMELLAEHGMAVGRESALDFGCGAGRLTLGLSPHFKRVTGCDISEDQLKVARSMAQGCNVGNARFVLSGLDLAAALGDERYDFINSFIVLQHMVPPLMKLYISQFCGLLKPGGAAAFQLPTHHPQYDFNLQTLKHSIDHRGIQLHVLPAAEVAALVEAGGCENVAAVPVDCVGPGWESHLFLVRKPAA